MNVPIMVKVAAKKKRNYLPYIAGGVGLAALGFGASKLLRGKKTLTGINKALHDVSIEKSLHDVSIEKSLHDVSIEKSLHDVSIGKAVSDTFNPSTFKPNTFKPNTFKPNTFPTGNFPMRG